MNRQEEAREYLDHKFKLIEYSIDTQTKVAKNSIDHNRFIINQIRSLRIFLIILFFLNFLLLAMMFHPVHTKLDFTRTFLKDHINIETDQIKSDIKFNYK